MDSSSPFIPVLCVRSTFFFFTTVHLSIFSDNGIYFSAPLLLPQALTTSSSRYVYTISSYLFQSPAQPPRHIHYWPYLLASLSIFFLPYASSPPPPLHAPHSSYLASSLSFNLSLHLYWYPSLIQTPTSYTLRLFFLAYPFRTPPPSPPPSHIYLKLVSTLQSFCVR